MDDFFSVDLFNKNISSLKETSKDKQENSISYMTDSDYEVVNFDGVKNDYIRGLCISETPCSNDAVCVLDDKDTIVFIEFKNGASIKKYELWKKIYDSVLIFNDLSHSLISETREKLEYILVYNEDKFQDNNGQQNNHNSKNRDEIGKQLGKLSNEEYIKFDLKQFVNYLFKSVHTYTKEEFEKNFIEKYCCNN